MARGQQKIQSQQKNAKKQAGQKKKQGHDQKAAAKAALIYTCTVCRTQMPDPKTFKQHFESKHPKTPLPPELADCVDRTLASNSGHHPKFFPKVMGVWFQKYRRDGRPSGKKGADGDHYLEKQGSVIRHMPMPALQSVMSDLNGQ
ncbi:Zinc finger protein 706, partial [Galemys pyrenaicus]